MTIIVNQKNKLKNIYIEFHVQIERIKKKNRFDERKCADKLYQRHFNKKMTFIKNK